MSQKIHCSVLKSGHTLFKVQQGPNGKRPRGTLGPGVGAGTGSGSSPRQIPSPKTVSRLTRPSSPSSSLSFPKKPTYPCDGVRVHTVPHLRSRVGNPVGELERFGVTRVDTVPLYSEESIRTLLFWNRVVECLWSVSYIPSAVMVSILSIMIITEYVIRYGQPQWPFHRRSNDNNVIGKRTQSLWTDIVLTTVTQYLPVTSRT